jgi:hypothetical protein
MNASILLLTLFGVTAIAGSAAVQLVFDDGLHHQVDATNSAPGDGIFVKNSNLGASTTITILAGADLGAHSGYPGVVATESSVVRIAGGKLNSDGPALATGSSHMIVTSGVIGDVGSVISLAAQANSTVDVFGGVFNGGGLLVNGNAIVNVMGGDFNTVRRAFWIEGDTGNPVINVFGWGFNYPSGPIADLSGTLTGVLADGSPFNNTFVRSNADIRLFLVPECSTACFCLLGLLLCQRRARRSSGLPFQRLPLPHAIGGGSAEIVKTITTTD